MIQVDFSVLISVYYAETAANLRTSLKSILIDQTLLPSQVVLVVDGSINETLELVVDEYLSEHSDKLQVLRLEKNMGLGYALKKGLLECKYEFVARMDTDDISHRLRFKKQFDFLNANQDISVVGSNIEEFHSSPGDLNVFKILPETSEELVKYSKRRSPVNHPSIMFRKSAVLAAGSYNGDFKLFEDYSLFARMITRDFKFYNMQEPLLFFRVGDRLEMIKRRSGWSYMKSEVRFLYFAYQIGHFSRIQFSKALCIRVPVRLLPPFMILKIYTIFLRK